MSINAQTLITIVVAIRMHRGHVGVLLRRGGDVIICRLVWADGLCRLHINDNRNDERRRELRTI